MDYKVLYVFKGFIKQSQCYNSHMMSLSVCNYYYYDIKTCEQNKVQHSKSPYNRIQHNV